MNSSLLTSAHQKKLLKKWAPILESGTPIQDQTVKVNLAQMLESTRNFFKAHGLITEAATPGITQPAAVGQSGVMAGDGVMNGAFSYPYAGGDKGYGDFYLPNVVLPMIRRIMPDLIANELVAVQPLNNPIGYALAYRPTYNNDGGVGVPGNPGKYGVNTVNGLTSNSELGYNPVDTRYTGTEATDEKTAEVANTDYWKAYAGETGRWLGEGVGLGADTEYASLHDNTYPTMSFGLVKSAVEAKTRKLAAHWSPELAEDMQAMHGIDVEKEMINSLTYEVGAEIDRQIVSEMVKAAILGGTTSEWNPAEADGLDQMGRLATLLTQINIEANNIAIRTKRGNANFAITTPRVCALLAQLGMNKYTSFKSSANIPTVPDTGVGALAKVGYLNDESMLLVRDAHVQNDVEDYLVMGYKGKAAGDSGIIYCPYVPLQLSKVMQPGSFTASVGARTRYGIMNNPFDSRNYYSFMKITTYSETGYKFSDGTRHFITKPSAVTPAGFVGSKGGPVVMPEA